LIEGMTFRSIVSSLGNPTSILTIITVLSTTLYLLIPSIRDFINEQIVDEFLDAGDEKGLRDYLDAQNLAATALGLVVPGGVFLKLGRVILGNLGVEAGEEIVDFATDALENQVVQPGIMQKFFVDLLILKRGLKKEVLFKPNFDLRDLRIF